VLVALSRPSRADVDVMVRKAVAAGGSTYNDPKTTISCTPTGFRIWMDTFGSFFHGARPLGLIYDGVSWIRCFSARSKAAPLSYFEIQTFTFQGGSTWKPKSL